MCRTLECFVDGGVEGCNRSPAVPTPSGDLLGSNEHTADRKPGKARLCVRFLAHNELKSSGAHRRTSVYVSFAPQLFVHSVLKCARLIPKRHQPFYYWFLVPNLTLTYVLLKSLQQAEDIILPDTIWDLLRSN